MSHMNDTNQNYRIHVNPVLPKPHNFKVRKLTSSNFIKLPVFLLDVRKDEDILSLQVAPVSQQLGATRVNRTFIGDM